MFSKGPPLTKTLVAPVIGPASGSIEEILRFKCSQEGYLSSNELRVL